MIALGRQGRALWLSVVALLGSWVAIILGALLSLAPLEFPQFAVAFIFGDPRWRLIACIAVGTGVALLVWRLGEQRGVLFGAARATVVIGGVLVPVVAWQHFGSYATSDTSFRSADVVLAARLYMPRSAAPHRGVVLVPGSESVDGRRYHSFADRWARAGYAVLVPDKRGVGRSGGVFQQPSPDDRGRILLDTLAADAAAGLRFLRTVAGVDSLRVGYFGLSQAGWVIPIAEQATTGAAFAVIVSGPAVSFGEEDLFSRLSGERGDHFGWKPPTVPFDSINARLAQEAPSGFDPRATLTRMSLPTLWLYGAWDNSIPVVKSVQNLDAARRALRPFTVHTYDYGNHGLFVMRGPAKRRLPYYADRVWSDTFAWVDSLTSR